MRFAHLVAWGRMMGSRDDYVVSEIHRAARERAPKDACYFSVDEQRWIGFSEIQREDTKAIVLRLMPKAA